MLMGFLLAAGVGADACLAPPGEACGGAWCAVGYRCASIDRIPICIKSTCSDGIVEVDEECDDGNLADNDDCLQTCRLSTCGDGRVNIRTEECDDGNAANGDGCDSNCTVTACGNGVVTAGEECEDGKYSVDNDGCNHDCTLSLLAYLKASNANKADRFGSSIALSADGSTLAVGATWEDSAATGIDGDQHDYATLGAGAVYVFTRSGATWRQQAYVKASNTDSKDWYRPSDHFGWSVALSADGSTLAVSAINEDSAAAGIDGNQADNSARDAGAVYVFTRSGTTWSQQAYVKASNTGAGDQFGQSVALSADGSTLAVGANYEDSGATGIGGRQTDNSAENAGAVYVFTRSGTTWSQQAYVKASNTDAGDYFGCSVALSADGSTMAVGAIYEASAATGIDGDPTNNSAGSAGAVYVFTRSGTTWSQQAYLKASNTDAGDQFGESVALSADGSTLTVGAWSEASAVTGIGGNQADNSAVDAGAVYVFTHSGAKWSQQAYLKASNTGAGDRFGSSIALSGDGSTLAVGAVHEASAATGIDGNQADNAAVKAGASYVFTRSDTAWSQQAYLKASNTGAGDQFGWSVALSADGSTLAVGAEGEASDATGIGGNQAYNAAPEAGAVYVFRPRAWLP
ncbi:MAG TPA: DUF4215 domain-containing protein [Kofleriaceae bacterium]|nr:DUF4215 domain-containing protein [Kofleriaceae bacterium]